MEAIILLFPFVLIWVLMLIVKELTGIRTVLEAQFAKDKEKEADQARGIDNNV